MALSRVLVACIGVLGVAELVALNGRAKAATDVPFASGFYVPADLKKSCGDPNFEAYDWVLKFASVKGRLTMSDSEGVCSLTILGERAKGQYRGNLECTSHGEKSQEAITFKTGDDRHIVEINGQPYAFCGARR